MTEVRRRAAFLAACYQRRLCQGLHPHVKRFEQRLARELPLPSLEALWEGEPIEPARGYPPIKFEWDERREAARVKVARVSRAEPPKGVGIGHVIGDFREVRARALRMAHEKMAEFGEQANLIREDSARELMGSATRVLRNMLRVAEGSDGDVGKEVRADMEKALRSLTSWLHPDVRNRLEVLAAAGSS